MSFPPHRGEREREEVTEVRWRNDDDDDDDDEVDEEVDDAPCCL